MKMRIMSDKLLKAKSLVQEVMDAWPSLPDEVDASSGQLEQAIELIGQVEGDIDDAYESGVRP